MKDKCARITCEADGPHASGDKPSRTYVPNNFYGASSPTERLRIESAGLVGIGTDNPGNVLHLQKNGGDAMLELQNSDFVIILESFLLENRVGV